MSRFVEKLKGLLAARNPAKEAVSLGEYIPEQVAPVEYDCGVYDVTTCYGYEGNMRIEVDTLVDVAYMTTDSEEIVFFDNKHRIIAAYPRFILVKVNRISLG